MPKNKEIWESFTGYKYPYEISNWGKVKNKHGRILKGYTSKEGYRVVTLVTGEGFVTKRIHRLVGLHFVPNPHNKPQINHIDEDKSNNYYLNLNWMTNLENSNHGTRSKRIAEANSVPVIQYSMAGKFIRGWKSSESTRSGGFIPQDVTDCCLEHRRSHGQHRWRYYTGYRVRDLDKLPANLNSIAIKQYSLNGKFIRSWDSARSTTSENHDPSAVIKCCKGRYRHHHGYIRVYAYIRAYR